MCDIQTDKAVIGFEVEEAGILAKILVSVTLSNFFFICRKIKSFLTPAKLPNFLKAPDDTKDVKIGTVIALLVEEGENWKDVEVPVDHKVVESEKIDKITPSSQETITSSSALASHV